MFEQYFIKQAYQLLLQKLAFSQGLKPGGTPPRKKQTRCRPQRDRLTRWIAQPILLRTPGNRYKHASRTV